MDSLHFKWNKDHVHVFLGINSSSIIKIWQNIPSSDFIYEKKKKEKEFDKMPFSCLVFFKMTCLQIQQQPAYNSEPQRKNYGLYQIFKLCMHASNMNKKTFRLCLTWIAFVSCLKRQNLKVIVKTRLRFDMCTLELLTLENIGEWFMTDH